MFKNNWKTDLFQFYEFIRVTELILYPKFVISAIESFPLSLFTSVVLFQRKKASTPTVGSSLS